MVAINSKTNLFHLLLLLLFLLSPTVVAASSSLTEEGLQPQQARDLDDATWTLSRSPQGDGNDFVETFHKRDTAHDAAAAARNLVGKIHPRDFGYSRLAARSQEDKIEPRLGFIGGVGAATVIDDWDHSKKTAKKIGSKIKGVFHKREVELIRRSQDDKLQPRLGYITGLGAGTIMSDWDRSKAAAKKMGNKIKGKFHKRQFEQNDDIF